MSEPVSPLAVVIPLDPHRPSIVNARVAAYIIRELRKCRPEDRLGVLRVVLQIAREADLLPGEGA